jgi:hypothetical protein
MGKILIQGMLAVKQAGYGEVGISLTAASYGELNLIDFASLLR